MFLFAFAETVQLMPDGTLFIHIGMILLMIYILNRTFFRPINRIIEARVKNKGGRFTEAEEILNKVSKKQTEYEADLLKARSEGYEIIEKERSEAMHKRQTEIEEVKAETGAMFEHSKEEIVTQTNEARTAIKSQADELADRISANILKV
jgi:F-type H+-transporting ATPase subunit b